MNKVNECSLVTHCAGALSRTATLVKAEMHPIFLPVSSPSHAQCRHAWNRNNSPNLIDRYHICSSPLPSGSIFRLFSSITFPRNMSTPFLCSLPCHLTLCTNRFTLNSVRFTFEFTQAHVKDVSHYSSQSERNKHQKRRIFQKNPCQLLNFFHTSPSLSLFRPTQIFSSHENLFGPRKSFRSTKIFSVHENLFAPRESFRPTKIFSVHENLFDFHFKPYLTTFRGLNLRNASAFTGNLTKKKISSHPTRHRGQSLPFHRACPFDRDCIYTPTLSAPGFLVSPGHWTQKEPLVSVK